MRCKIQSGTPELEDAGTALYQEGQGGQRCPFNLKDCELSEMLVEFFYEFASENARNAVIELQE